MPDAGLEPANRYRIAAITRIVTRFSLIRLQAISSNLWQRATQFLFWGLASPVVPRYAHHMKDATVNRSWGLTTLLIGSGLLAGGGLLDLLIGGSTFIGACFGLCGFAGAILIIVGIVQSIREHVQHRDLSDEASRTIIGQPAASSVGDELGTLNTLHEQGSLTDDEFVAAKAKILRT